jgi:hypothetical protein
MDQISIIDKNGFERTKRLVRHIVGALLRLRSNLAHFKWEFDNARLKYDRSEYGAD